MIGAPNRGEELAGLLGAWGTEGSNRLRSNKTGARGRSRLDDDATAFDAAAKKLLRTRALGKESRPGKNRA